MSVTDDLSVNDDEGVTDDASLSEDHLNTRDVKHRAVTGAVVDTLRSIGVRFVRLLGALVTARLLTPYDFGLVAIGTTMFAFGDFLDDGGVGVGADPTPGAADEVRAAGAARVPVRARPVLLVVIVGS